MRDTELLRYSLFPGLLGFPFFLLKKVRCLFEVAKPPSLFRAKTYIGSTVRRTDGDKQSRRSWLWIDGFGNRAGGSDGGIPDRREGSLRGVSQEGNDRHRQVAREVRRETNHYAGKANRNAGTSEGHDEVRGSGGLRHRH